jgi:hypothetical protein
MKRSLLNRIDRLERARASSGPLLIVSFEPLPDAPTAETVERWLEEGLARRCQGARHVVIFNGGQPPMTTDQWEATYGRRSLNDWPSDRS